jgi:hypothetical protein
VKRALRCGRLAAASLATAAILAACSSGGGSPSRSSVFPEGFSAMSQYHADGNTRGTSQQNSLALQGTGAIGPIPLAVTSFGKGAGLRTETVQVIDQAGRPVYALGMGRREYTVGVTKYLDMQVGYFQQMSVLGQSLCGIKVRLDFLPNAWQFLTGTSLGQQAWEGVALYSVPCAMGVLPGSSAPTPTSAPSPTATPAASSTSSPTAKAKATPGPSASVSAAASPTVPPDPAVHLDIAHAKMISLTISQMLAPRLFSKPWLTNGGNAATLVGGQLAALKPGWWENPISTQYASEVVGHTIQNLSRHGWEGFTNGSYGTLLWVSGDASSFLTWQKLILNRQGNYLVSFRVSPTAPWIHIAIERQYDVGWNDWTKNYKSFFGQDMPKIDDLVNPDGTMKDISGSKLQALQDIRSSGCMNCPNPSLAQIRWVINGHVVYADTFRGFWGSDSSLLMMGNVPSISPTQADSRAEQIRQDQGAGQCQLQVDQSGAVLPDDQQFSDKQCAQILEDGALTKLLVTDPSKYGFDQVLNEQVTDNSTVISSCDDNGSGGTTCHLQVQDIKLDASYGYTDLGQGNYRALAVNTLMGPDGATNSGLGYAAGPSTGSGTLLALALPTVRTQYYSNLLPTPQNYARLFLLDTPGLTAPGMLMDAAAALGYGHQN